MTDLTLSLDDTDLPSLPTRQQAIEDGTLVDATTGELSPITHQYFTVEVAMTAAVSWALDAVAEGSLNDRRGAWNDICSMLRTAIELLPETSSQPEIHFSVVLSRAGRSKYWTLKAVKGLDGHGAPCLTLKLPDEA
ncbi:MAG: hypothetical protein M3O15_15925 [Acidobacteriota bacterium]|nr:hypothetical protein [Acidobacteriota bacterium]